MCKKYKKLAHIIFLLISITISNCSASFIPYPFQMGQAMPLYLPHYQQEGFNFIELFEDVSKFALGGYFIDKLIGSHIFDPYLKFMNIFGKKHTISRILSFAIEGVGAKVALSMIYNSKIPGFYQIASTLGAIGIASAIKWGGTPKTFLHRARYDAFKLDNYWTFEREYTEAIENLLTYEQYQNNNQEHEDEEYESDVKIENGTTFQIQYADKRENTISLEELFSKNNKYYMSEIRNEFIYSSSRIYLYTIATIEDNKLKIENHNLFLKFLTLALTDNLQIYFNVDPRVENQRFFIKHNPDNKKLIYKMLFHTSFDVQEEKKIKITLAYILYILFFADTETVKFQRNEQPVEIYEWIQKLKVVYVSWWKTITKTIKEIIGAGEKEIEYAEKAPEHYIERFFELFKFKFVFEIDHTTLDVINRNIDEHLKIIDMISNEINELIDDFGKNEFLEELIKTIVIAKKMSDYIKKLIKARGNDNMSDEDIIDLINNIVNNKTLIFNSVVYKVIGIKGGIDVIASWAKKKPKLNSALSWIENAIL
jgi:hypothetical protein